MPTKRQSPGIIIIMVLGNDECILLEHIFKKDRHRHDDGHDTTLDKDYFL